MEDIQVTARQDQIQDLHEQFYYDQLNRVTYIGTTTGYSSGGATTWLNHTYDARGNILSRTGVGSYTYGLADASCASWSAGPHALTSITWRAFDKPLQIVRAGNTVDFSYGPDRARFRRVDNTLSSDTTTTAPGGGLTTTRESHWFQRDNLGSSSRLSRFKDTLSRCPQIWQQAIASLHSMRLVRRSRRPERSLGAACCRGRSSHRCRHEPHWNGSISTEKGLEACHDKTKE